MCCAWLLLGRPVWYGIHINVDAEWRKVFFCCLLGSLVWLVGRMLSCIIVVVNVLYIYFGLSTLVGIPLW